MATAIQVVLQRDVDNLGDSGDVVKVRTGFARNFLIPRGMAVVATKANIARVADIKKAAKVRAAKELEEAREVAGKLENVAVKLERAVGDENKMYGSVTSKDIEEAFAAAGLPEGVFQFLHLDHGQVGRVIADARVAHVAFTGSVPGGLAVQRAAREGVT